MGLFAALRVDTEQNSIACHYAKCRNFFVMPSIVSLTMLLCLHVNSMTLSIMYDTQHYDTHHYGIQHYDTQHYDMQHYGTQHYDSQHYYTQH